MRHRSGDGPVAEDPALRCAACDHVILYDDDVRTVGGRRFHATCVDAHRGEAARSGEAVSVLARWIERWSRALGR
jgi:hypothetical protein